MTRRAAVWALAALSMAILIPMAGALTPRRGERVIAQWRPNQWLPGTVGAPCPGGFAIAFERMKTTCLATALIAPDAPASAEALRPGGRVLARWTDGNLYPATVHAATGARLEVTYDDGATRALAAPDLRAIPEHTPAHRVGTGDVVWAQWKPNAWFKGRVDGACAFGLHVAFDDGDQACVAVDNITADAAPAAREAAVGARVLARWTDGRLYPGTITGLPETGGFRIDFDDHDRLVVDLRDLRLLAR